MNLKKRPYFNIGLTIFSVIAASIFLFFFIFHIKEIAGVIQRINLILRPIYYGLILAFLLLPIHRRIFGALKAMTPDQKLKDRRNVSFLNGVAILSSVFFLLFILYMLIIMVLPQLYLQLHSSIVGLIDALPNHIDRFQDWLVKFLDNNPSIQSAVVDYYNSVALSVETWLKSDVIPNLQSLDSTFNWLKISIFPSISGVMTNVYSVILALLLFLKDFLIGVIVSVYLLARKDLFAAQAKKITYSLFPAKFGDLIVRETRNTYRIMSGFINGKLLDSLIIAIICFVFCQFMSMPYPTLLATIIGVTNIIPFFGPFIGAIPCALLVLLVNPMQCLYFVIFIFILQQFDGNILGPKILGDSTGLSSFWVLFSILLFGGLFGFPGMIFGVPVFAAIYSIVSRLVQYLLRRRHLPPDTEFYLGATDSLTGYHPPAPSEGGAKKSE